MAQPPLPFAPEIERYHPDLDRLLDADARVEIIASGFAWTEGPAWDARGQRLLFSDIPNNRIHTWSPDEGLGVFLDPAGRIGPTPYPEAMPGTNGLSYLADEHALLICNQDARSVDSLDLGSGERICLAAQYQGARFNSPNDVVRGPDGGVYFTDPPFGLLDRADCKERDLAFTGVFKVEPGGKVVCVSDQTSMPNGLVFTPDGQTLFVSQSDPAAQHILALPVRSDGRIGPAKLWCDLGLYSERGDAGLPDGMAVDTDGYLYATCAGGVAIIAPDGKMVGRIRTGRATSNCTFGEDGHVLFITSHDLVLRMETRSQGLG